MTPNWWGDESGPAHALNPSGTGDSVPDGVVYSPWLGIGTDASGAPGFQLASPMTWIAGPDVCGVTCIQAAIDDASDGDTVKAKTGVFPEHVIVNKSIVLTAGSNPIVDGGGSGDGITVTAPNATVSSFEVRNVTNGIVIAADDATISSNDIHDFTSAAVRGSSASGASVASNTIDGGHTASCVGGFWGIIVASVSGTIDGNTVSGIGSGLPVVGSGCQEGRAIEADGSGTLQITNNDVSQYQKSGIIVNGTVASTISGNTTTGEGATDKIAQNGITVTSSGTTSISGNHTSGHRYTPESNVSCGILTYGATATVSGNDSTDDEVGICAVGGSGSSVTGNTVTHHRQQGIYIDSVSGITVDSNMIDGQAGGTTASAGTDPDTDTRYYGVFAVDSTGTISNNTITGITHGVASGIQSGVGIKLSARNGTSADMTISSNNITDVQKNAMVITNQYGGTSVNANIHDNTVDGNGAITYIAQNGIQVSGGATASIANNHVSGYDYTGTQPAAAVGILLFGAGTTSVTGNIVHDNMEGMYAYDTDNVVATGNTFSTTRDTAIVVWLASNGTYTSNTITGMSGSTGMYFYDASSSNDVTASSFTANDYGIIVDDSGPGAPLDNHFHQNSISGNATYGFLQYGTLVGPVIDAENNWWGACSGPSGAGPGTGDAVSTNVDFSPFTHGACDTDGDLLTDDSETLVYGTDYLNPDTDGDGCNDGREVLLTNHLLGGDRDPLDFWDFFDVTGDKQIDLSDTLDVLSYFGDPGLPNTPGDLRDRAILNPAKPWRTSDSDDGVDITDALNSLASFGDSCAGSP